LREDLGFHYYLMGEGWTATYSSYDRRVIKK